MSEHSIDLKQLPQGPGVYLYKDASRTIIYVGKAKVLKKRISQYFQKNIEDAKTRQLVKEIASVDTIITGSELDALLLESELIKRYKPKFNILLRDDKSAIYIKLKDAGPNPYFGYSRTAEDADFSYIGPFYNAYSIRQLMKALRKIFPYSTHQKLPKRSCLHAQIGRCPNLEGHPENLAKYKKDILNIKKVLSGQRLNLISDFKKQMNSLATELKFEEASVLKNKISALSFIDKNISVFEDDRLASQDEALTKLKLILNLKDDLTRIEGYDISHMSGTDTVASMVVATNGMADKSQYRIFHSKIAGNDDFAHMREVILRRFNSRHQSWTIPNLILIDGGKGQLRAAIESLKTHNLKIPIFGLAKKHETIVIDKAESHIKLNMEELSSCGGVLSQNSEFIMVNFPPESPIVKLLERVRDESHRFGVLHHTKLKRRRNISSELLSIPGIGKQTAIKLQDSFGSVTGVKSATKSELGQVLGNITGKKVWNYFNKIS